MKVLIEGRIISLTHEDVMKVLIEAPYYQSYP